jgi:tetratricopeptide (TPR) repeat protein
LDPQEVLAGFLRELGVARAAVPESLEERARLFRARLDKRRILVVLDNAADETQVRPMIPGGAGCAVLVTSRSVIAGIAGVTQVYLEQLRPEQALDLLSRIVGHDRITMEPAAADKIVRLCGYLPLAVRIAGSKLASKRHWSLASFASRLSDERNRLSELTVGDLEVRASFALSYHGLEEPEQRLFRLLGLLDVPDFQAWIPAALVSGSLTSAERSVERLVDMQLLEVTEHAITPASRYRFHDLLRVFARERLREEDPEPARRAALEPALKAYLTVAERAYAAVEPGDVYDSAGPPSSSWPATDHELIATLLRDPIRWFALERPSLTVAVEQAYQKRFWELTYRLAIALYGSFSVGAHWHAWQRVYHLALDAARQAEDRYAEAKVMLRLGDVYKNSGRVDGPGGTPEAHREDVIAAEWLEQSRVAFHQLTAKRREAAVLRRLGGVYRDLGRFEKAEACYKEGLALASTLPDGDLARAYLLRGYGALHRMAGRHNEAVQCFDEALTVLRQLDDLRGELGALRGLGETYLQLRRWTEAEDCFEQHLTVDREIGDRHAEAHSLRGLGEVRLGQHRHDEAVTYFEQCLPLFREIGHRSSEAETLGSLSSALAGLGRRSAARTIRSQSAAIFRELGMADPYVNETLEDSSMNILRNVVRRIGGQLR